MSERLTRSSKFSLSMCALLFLTSGIFHFVQPSSFKKIVPQYIPFPSEAVSISGIFEILGAIGLHVPKTRPLASYGLIALLVAVFPANFEMLRKSGEFPQIPVWVLWARLPLQAVLVYWAWSCGRLGAGKSSRRMSV